MRSLHTIYRLFTALLKPIILYHVILVKNHIFPSYTRSSRSVLARLHMLFALCTGIQDRLGFWIPRGAFQIPGTGFQSLFFGTWIPIVSCIQDSLSYIPDSLSCIPDSKTKVMRIPQTKISRIPESGLPCTWGDVIWSLLCANFFILPVIRETRQTADVK